MREYDYHCLAKGFTKKLWLINEELKQLKNFFSWKKSNYSTWKHIIHDLKACVRLKQRSGLQP